MLRWATHASDLLGRQLPDSFPTRFPDHLGIIMIGEIGGSAEEEAADWIKARERSSSGPVRFWSTSDFLVSVALPPY